MLGASYWTERDSQLNSINGNKLREPNTKLDWQENISLTVCTFFWYWQRKQPSCRVLSRGLWLHRGGGHVHRDRHHEAQRHAQTNTQKLQHFTWKGRFVRFLRLGTDSAFRGIDISYCTGWGYKTINILILRKCLVITVSTILFLIVTWRTLCKLSPRCLVCSVSLYWGACAGDANL